LKVFHSANAQKTGCWQGVYVGGGCYRSHHCCYYLEHKRIFRKEERKMVMAERKEKIIKFPCCHCGCSITMPEPITTAIRGGGKYSRRSWLEKIYCPNPACEEQHRKAIRKPGGMAEYKHNLQKLRNRLRNRILRDRGLIKEKIEKEVLFEKKGYLFRGDISLGKIIGKNDRFVFVQKSPLDSIQHYQGVHE